jgi:hypothetical protein
MLKIVVGIPSVANGGNVVEVSGVVDAIDDPIIANPYPPKILVAL